MGSILVGQKKQKTVDMGGVTIVPNSGVNAANKGGMTTGKGTQEDASKKRLAEIMALPVEEQLPLLLEEGFTEEAQKLSEDLAISQKEHTDDGTGEENTGTEVPADGTTTELAEGVAEAPESAKSPVEESKKKKVGRPKKSEE